MQWFPLGWLRAVMLGGALLLGHLTPIAWAQAESAQSTPTPFPPAERSMVLFLDDGKAEIFVSELVVVLGGILGGGLLLGGLAAYDLRRDRREDR